MGDIMASLPPNVLGIFGAPTREDSLRAISRCLLRVRADHGLTACQFGKLLDCSDETVNNAINEKSLLSADSVARLGYFFPDEFALVEELWPSSAAPAPSVEDRFDRLERELNALRRDVAA